MSFNRSLAAVEGRRFSRIARSVAVTGAGLAFVGVMAGCSSSGETTAVSEASSTGSAPATTTPTPTTTATTTMETSLPPAAEPPVVPAPEVVAAPVLMPPVVCMNLQAAQNLIQDAGVFLSRSEDATGAGRMQVNDSNWIVVGQTPGVGVPIEEGDAVLSVVKVDEPNNC